jgi:hypothetical protein
LHRIRWAPKREKRGREGSGGQDWQRKEVTDAGDAGGCVEETREKPRGKGLRKGMW